MWLQKLHITNFSGHSEEGGTSNPQVFMQYYLV